MVYEQIRLEVAGDGVATITLDRPARRNAWTREMGTELRHALGQVDTRDDVRAAVVTGAGRDFCVGADLEGGGTLFDETRRQETQGIERAPLAGWEVRKPIIAALNGAAAGVGATVPLHWDIRLAGESTRIGFVFVRRGLVPEAASTWILPRLVGLGRATELLLTGRVLDAQEALAYGLVSRVVPDAELVGAATELARDLAANTSPVAVALTKRLLWENAGAGDPAAAERLDAKVFGWATQQPDAREGIRAFVEKRPPRFGGRVGTDLPALDAFRPPKK